MISADCFPEDITLALNGCEDRLQLALGYAVDDKTVLLASRQWTVPGQSVKHLVPGIAEVVHGLKLPMERITRIAATRGPGSFTGMRIVLATAMGLAAGHEAALVGIEYLHALACGPAALLPGPLHVLTYARRGLVYFQSFSCPQATALCPPTVLSVEDACHTIMQGDPHAVLVGSAIRKNTEAFSTLQEQQPSLQILDEQWDSPAPETLLRMALEAKETHTDIEPLYLRASDAEENLAAIAAKRGLDPKLAEKRLHKYS